MVFLEAAASGIPQIAGDSGGASEAVVHGETGFVVPAYRTNTYMAETLRDLLKALPCDNKWGKGALAG